MVFESVVVNVLNSLLGDYFVNLDPSQLKLGIWGGNAVLKDLKLKDSALDNLGLPFKVSAGKLGSLTLQIPWKNIYTSPVVIDIQDLLVIVMPSHAIVYDEKLEDKAKQDQKRKEIDKLTAEILAKKSKTDDKEDSDTFAEKLVAQIIKNVQIKIENIHIRYEDEVTKPGSPFSFGILLKSFSVHTCDDKWTAKTIVDKVLTNYKMAALEGLSFYWNTNQTILSQKDANIISVYEHLRQIIQGEDNEVMHVVGPISLEAKIRLTPTPEKGPKPFSLPKAIIEVVMQELLFGMTSLQFQDMLELSAAIDMMFRAKSYRKYRPQALTYRGHYSAWWKYSFDCIMHEEIKRRRANWSWRHIKEHRDTMRGYYDIYYQKLSLKSPTPLKLKEIEKAVEHFEDQLDVFNIMLVRRQVEIKIEEDTPAKPQAAAGGGWFSGWWSKAPAPGSDQTQDINSTAELARQFVNEFSSEEKKKLYKAINYEENDKPIEYPADFAEYKLVLVLKRIKLIIKDDVSPEVHFNKTITLTMNDISTEICTRNRVEDNFEQILLEVNSTLTELRLTLNSDRKKLLNTVFGQLTVSYRQKAQVKEIEAELRRLNIQNMDQTSLYKEVINVTEDKVVNVLVKIYQEATKGNNYYDMEKHDVHIDVETGSPRIFYVSSFLFQVLDFIDSFLPNFLDKKTVLDASIAAAEIAKTNVQEAYGQISRIAMDIKLKAPKVIVPKNSKSHHAVLMDFGILQIENVFKKGHYEGITGQFIVEDIKLNLSDMQMSRVIIDKEDQSIITECTLIEPITFKLSIERNLSNEWFHEIPDLLIHGHLDSTIIKCSSEDYQVIMDCIMDNISISPVPGNQTLDIRQEVIPQVKKSNLMVIEAVELTESLSKLSTSTSTKPSRPITPSKKSSRKSLKSKAPVERVLEDIKITLFFGNLNILLFEGSTRMENDTGVIKHSESSSLADFSIRKTILNLSMKNNGDMTCNVKAADIVLEDVREGERAIISLIQKRTDENVVQADHIVNVTYEVDANSKDKGVYIHIQTTSLTVVLCLEYLMQVGNFFIDKRVDKSESKELQDQAIEDMYSERAIEQMQAKSSKSIAAIMKSEHEQQVAIATAVDTDPMTIYFNMAETELILVETTKRYDTLALLMNCTITTKTVITPTRTACLGTIGNLKLSSCRYDPKIRMESLAEVMSPMAITLVVNISETVGTFIDISLSNIFLRLTAGTIDLLLKVTSSFLTPVEGDGDDQLHAMDYTHLWDELPLEDDMFWFLSPDVIAEMAEDALKQEVEKPKLLLKQLSAPVIEERLVIESGCIIITFETGKGLNTVPMLLLESEMTIQALEWSSKLKASGRVKLEAAYFNTIYGMWEYIIEPVESRAHGRVSHIPWELEFDYANIPRKDKERSSSLGGGSSNQGSMYSISSAGAESNVPDSAALISLTSEDNLEMTVTKTSLDVLGILAEEFQNSVKSLVSQRIVSTSPYIIVNDCGSEIQLDLIDSPFVLIRNGILYEEATLHQGTSINLALKEQFDLTKHKSSILREQETYKERLLHVTIKEYNFDVKIPVGRAEKRYYNLTTKKADWGTPYGLVCDIGIKDASKVVTFRGMVQIINDLKISVDVYYMEDNGETIKLAGTVRKHSKLNLPISCIYTKSGELFFAPKGFSASTTPFVWTCLLRDLEGTAYLNCKSKREDLGEFNIKAVGHLKHILFESTFKKTISSQCIFINLKPPVIINNLLPTSLGYYLDTNKHAVYLAQRGETVHVTRLSSVREGVNLNLLIPDYENTSWTCHITITKETEELSAWEFASEGKEKMISYLGIHKEVNDDMIILHVYCPFWMINRTGLSLAYKADDHEEVTHPHQPTDQEPKMFAFKGKAFFSKKKATLRIDKLSDWCDKFSMDVAGSGGTVSCKSPNGRYEIGVEIKLTKWGLTKIVIFTPRYYLVNQCPFNVVVYEKEYPEHKIQIVKNKCLAFWPRSTHAHLISYVEGTNEETQPFKYDSAHNTLLLLMNRYGGMHSDIHASELFTKITLSQYVPGQAPVLAINSTHQTVIEFVEKGVDGTRILMPGTYQLLAWDNPSGEKIMTWYSGSATKKTNYNEKFVSDGFGTYYWNKTKSHKDESEHYWVSFLDGVQRIILYTSDAELAMYLHSSREMEQLNSEVEINLAGIGLSLVDNEKSKEIIYLRISSSNVEWQARKSGKSKKYKALKPDQIKGVEQAYKSYMTEKAISKNVKSRKTLDCGVEIDFATDKLFHPFVGEVRRIYQIGIWAKYILYPHSACFHAKINRVQIDNQLADCIFRIILSPIIPQRSISSDEIQKPFAEISILQRYTAHSSVIQYKYFKVLIQEFHVRSDIIFINAILDMFSTTTEKKLDYIVEEFHKDHEEYTKNLDVFYSQQLSSQGVKSFYDFLHFSPLKIHVSFSMGGGTQLNNNFLNLLLQSFGVTITEIEDVIFELACLELQHKFLSSDQLYIEAYDHYTSQLIKQLYVLVLGLDVIGNPYGLFLGVSEGVQAFFYEPYHGAIQGPGEFVEGFGLGVKTLIGQTFSGTAGALGRITGTMGKGVAALTMDDEYQKKRRENLNKRPHDVTESLARSGKGLFMGVFDGITGVVRNPIKGAQKEGFGGFFKGVGKGAIGLVARPVGGLIDFTSGSLDSIKRATSVNNEVFRMRLPRYLPLETTIRPYISHEAEGINLLLDLEKGKYLTTDHYIAHAIINPHGHFVILVTNKRVFYLKKNEVFGNWDTTWSYTYEEFEDVPVLVERGIAFKLKDMQKGGAFSRPSKKELIVPFHVPDACNWILSHIEKSYKRSIGH